CALQISHCHHPAATRLPARSPMPTNARLSSIGIPPPRGMCMRRSLVVLALSTALFAVAGCSKDEAAGAGPGGGMPPPEVGVVVMQPGTVPVSKELVGRLSAFRRAALRTGGPGVLEPRPDQVG